MQAPGKPPPSPSTGNIRPSTFDPPAGLAAASALALPVRDRYSAIRNHRKAWIVSDLQLMHLGQSGFRLSIDGITIYIDPYLSDFVETLEGPAMRRMREAVLSPADIEDADWVFVSHIHPDHCDPLTLRPIAAKSSRCRFLAPYEVVSFLEAELDVPPDKVTLAGDHWIALSPSVKVLPIPAAHRSIERNSAGQARCVGFLLSHADLLIYHSGDCSVDPEIVQILQRFGGIDIALLPVNECNYYRDRAGIIGNMSIREAFGFAEEIAARAVVPMHYDMFAPNRVYEEEIEAVYRNARPAFRLIMPAALPDYAPC
jgi:L-ascorbate metabolism protein UlaG (beta-lactamase superfamily)